MRKIRKNREIQWENGDFCKKSRDSFGNSAKNSEKHGKKSSPSSLTLKMPLI